MSDSDIAEEYWEFEDDYVGEEGGEGETESASFEVPSAPLNHQSSDCSIESVSVAKKLHHGERKGIFRILETNDIKRRQKKVIKEVCEITSLSSGEASILLRHFKWNQTNLQVGACPGVSVHDGAL
jgi:hypothetical protein